MYKIIFKDPENNNSSISKIISEFEAKKAFRAKKDKTSYSVPGYGLISHSLIITIKPEKQEQKYLSEPNTRWETEPPTEYEIRSIQLGVVFLNPYPIMFQASTSFFNGVVKSVWNWNSKKTQEILTIGDDLIKDGMTMRKMITEIDEHWKNKKY